MNHRCCSTRPDVGRGARGGDRVVRLAAQEGDRPLLIEPTQLLAPHPFQPRPGLLPDLHPAPRQGDLIGTPVCEPVFGHQASIRVTFRIARYPGEGLFPGLWRRGQPTVPWLVQLSCAGVDVVRQQGEEPVGPLAHLPDALAALLRADGPY